MPLLPNLLLLFGVLFGEFLVVQLGLPSVVAVDLAGIDAAVAEGATDHAGMLALGDELAVRPRIVRRRRRQFVLRVFGRHVCVLLGWDLPDCGFVSINRWPHEHRLHATYFAILFRWNALQLWEVEGGRRAAYRTLGARSIQAAIGTRTSIQDAVQRRAAWYHVVPLILSVQDRRTQDRVRKRYVQYAHQSIK